MKKYLTVLVIFISTTNIYAQAFQDGNLHLKGGIGIGSPYYLNGTNGLFPPLSFSADYCIKDKIGIGGIVGTTASRYVENNGYYIVKQTYRLIGGRATYHFWSQEHWDVYLGGMMGYVFPGWKITYSAKGYSVDQIYRPRFGGVKLAGFAGANYSVNNNWGVFGEIGYSLSFVTGGAYWRFSSVK